MRLVCNRMFGNIVLCYKVSLVTYGRQLYYNHNVPVPTEFIQVSAGLYLE